VVTLFAINLAGDNDSLSVFALSAVCPWLKLKTKDESVNLNKFSYYKGAHLG